MVRIPNLRDTPFHRIQVDLEIPFDRLPVSDHEDVQLRQADPDEDWACCAELDSDVFAYVQTEYDSESQTFRGSLSISFDRFPSKSPWIGRWEGWSPTSPELITKSLVPFVGNITDMSLQAMFSVDRASIPDHGLIASMIGLKTVSGEEQFLLSGAQFAVRGFPDDTVSWYLSPGKKAKEVSGQVVRGCTEHFRAESILDATHIVQARFNRFVLAQSAKVHDPS